MLRLALAALAVGLGLRLLAFAAHEHPRGDVVLDVGVTRSLLAGEGFASGFERGLPKLVGEAPVPPQDRADQHPPLWPLLGVAPAWLVGDPFTGLKLTSLLLSFVLLVLVWRVADRLCEGVVGAPDGLPALAAGFVSACYLTVEAAGNGSLYTAQALGVLLLVEALARGRALRAGLVLGLLVLLNHQCLVLAPLPVVVALLAGGGRGDARRRAVVGSLVALGVAAAVQVPWWWRNHEVFGSATHSVNAIYFLYRAGVDVQFGVEQGVPVLRFAEALGPALMLRSSLGFLMPNLLYVLSTGLLVWPALLALSAVGALPLLGQGVREGDRRLLALLGATTVLAVVAVLWPATKARYLVSLVPLVALLGVRVLARPPAGLERALAWLFGLGWLGLLGLTADDGLALLDPEGAAPDARPERWAFLAVGGLALVGAPLVLHLLRRGGRAADERRRDLIGRGLVVITVGLAGTVGLGSGPGTAYHATVFAPDVFGRDGDSRAERESRGLAVGRRAALDAGAEVVAGPVGLLAWESPRLVEVSAGLPGDWLEQTLAALMDGARPDGTRIDHVLLLAEDAAGLVGEGETITAGRRLVGGRLVVVRVLHDEPFQAGTVLLRAP